MLIAVSEAADHDARQAAKALQTHQVLQSWSGFSGGVPVYLDEVAFPFDDPPTSEAPPEKVN